MANDRPNQRPATEPARPSDHLDRRPGAPTEPPGPGAPTNGFLPLDKLRSPVRTDNHRFDINKLPALNPPPPPRPEDPA